MRGTVLVVGAGGFLGGFIAAALHGAGWKVLRGVRGRAHLDQDERACDLSRWQGAADCMALLDGVDAVVNVAGILRERAGHGFEQIHHRAPLALAEACVARGIPAFVQISALGDAADGGFIASKHRFDAALNNLPLRGIVLRPSVVYSAKGSYGGTSLLRALSALPGLLVLPGDGHWRLQPLAAEDLAQLVVRALDSNARGIFEVGGPQVLSLRDYLCAWRDWLRLPRARELHVPKALVSIATQCGEWLGQGPMGMTMWRMLQRGNVCAAEAHALLKAQFGIAPRALSEVLATRPSQVQDRWQARLYLLAPMLRFGVVALFLLSAWAGLVTPADQIEAMVQGSVLQAASPVQLARLCAGIDLALGLALLVAWRPRVVITLMIALVLGYTLAFGTLLPSQWLDPLGGLAKNLVILPALAVLWVLSERR